MEACEKISQEPLTLGSLYLINRLYSRCRQPDQLLINGRLLINILIVCITNTLGTLLIYAQIVGATGLQK